MLKLTMRDIAITVFMVFCLSAVAAASDSSFTQADRDRLLRLEEGLKSTNQRIDDMKADVNKRFDDMNRRFDQITNFMLWGFGILFGLFFSGMGFLVGFVLWDRRTALAPAVQRTELLERALKEASITNPEIKEALKHVGLL